jgi:hypothetical protein
MAMVAASQIAEFAELNHNGCGQAIQTVARRVARWRRKLQQICAAQN